ncbi:unnamed protein product [Enterobius vermicularis]|uniref:Uncharacterized protein n=1 Tax=Enterobius vermicularis TaxID=51028 RepID=A0A0N4VR03_ENTVE|nr:unnamed protein product [Enterobius vermicularis]
MVNSVDDDDYVDHDDDYDDDDDDGDFDFDVDVDVDIDDDDMFVVAKVSFLKFSGHQRSMCFVIVWGNNKV